MRASAAAAIVALVAALATAAPAMAQDQSPDTRAAALVGQMTLDEKLQLVHGHGVCEPLKAAGFIPGIPRLGIPDIQYTDAGTGIADCGKRPNGRSTMLPSPLARASSWDPATAHEAGALLGMEARVQGFTGLLGGAAELIRDPRWGRSFETPGEDPLLNGRLVAAEVRGVQSRKVVGTLKHFAANNQETGRMRHDVAVDERTLRELHLLPYEIAVPASGAQSVMCSYNRVNGPWACESDYLLNRVLKGEFGFKGQVQSDWGATHSAVGAALAGLDEEEPGDEHFGLPLRTAVLVGQVPVARLDDMVRRKLRGLIAVGVLDDPPPAPGSIDAGAGAWRAERLARRSIVLLKNRRGLLPLKRSVGSIAVIGEHADKGVLSGGGSSQVTPPGGPAAAGCDPEASTRCPLWAPSSPLEAIRARAPRANVRFAPASDPAGAVALARDSDVAVVFAYEWRREASDRQDLALPDGQEELIRQVAAANRRTVVVLENGGPVTMPWAGGVRSILEAWYPGSSGAPAIADVLFGRTNPSGKLPVTFPRSLADTPTGAAPPSGAGRIPYSEGLLVGYRWYDARGIAPQFAFGHGLSYTRWRYSRVRVRRVPRGLRVSFGVRNIGRRKGAEVAQVYVGLPNGAGEPPKRLAGWTRVRLGPGKRRRVSVNIGAGRLALWDSAANGWRVPRGRYRVFVGSSSRDIRLRGGFAIRR